MEHAAEPFSSRSVGNFELPIIRLVFALVYFSQG